jgi:hypothetical protein
MFFLSLVHLLRQPLYQVGFFLLLTMVLIPLLRAKGPNAIWNVAGVLYIGFIFANAIFFWFEDGIWSYFFISLVYSLLYLLLAGVLVSLLIEALKIDGSGESAMIFLFIIYHPVILLMVILLKWIVRSI